MIKFIFGSKKLVEIVRENDELHRAMGDILLAILEAKKGNRHLSIKTSNPEAGFVLNQLIDNFEAIRDHFKK